MEPKLSMNCGRALRNIVHWVMVIVIAALMLGCSEKYISKHRDYADPDDELYGMRAIERTDGSVQKV